MRALRSFARFSSVGRPPTAKCSKPPPPSEGDRESGVRRSKAIEPISSNDDLTTVAFKVCTALERSGIRAVLTGGSAATVYVPEAYQSRDLDFVLTIWSTFAGVEAVVAQLGYIKADRVYKHPAIIPTLDFPGDEMMVGDDAITEIATLRRDDMLLHILTPTDCVRDRLASYYFFKDVAALKAAIAVAKAHKVDLTVIEQWSTREGEIALHAVFVQKLAEER